RTAFFTVREQPVPAELSRSDLAISPAGIEEAMTISIPIIIAIVAGAASLGVIAAGVLRKRRR
ncbi:MAG: hypothetical protein V3R87_00795, partial [Dehalococcoidia bacterium]